MRSCSSDRFSASGASPASSRLARSETCGRSTRARSARSDIVRLGMSSVKHEFMADLVLANGKTVSEMMASDEGLRLLPPAEMQQ